MEKIEKIFNDLIKEACQGKVLIDDEDWSICFNTLISGKNSYIINESYPTLVIDNYLEFIKYLTSYVNLELQKRNKTNKYLSDDDYLKFIISFVWTNATTEDFTNPIQFLQRRISFLENDLFNSFNENFELGDSFNQSYLNVANAKQSIMMETPNKMTFTIKGQTSEDAYGLPEISYGITKDNNGNLVCYVYDIINHSQNIDKNNSYYKFINRLLFKLDSGIMDQESNEFIEYRNGESTYYPENITDITKGSLVSLLCFLRLLQNCRIDKVVFVPYLPLRYLSRKEAIEKQNDLSLKEKYEKRNEQILNNAIDKFIRTVRRGIYHLSNIEIISYPYESDENLHTKINDVPIEIRNELLLDLFKGLNQQNHLNR